MSLKIFSNLIINRMKLITFACLLVVVAAKPGYIQHGPVKGHYPVTHGGAVPAHVVAVPKTPAVSAGSAPVAPAPASVLPAPVSPPKAEVPEPAPVAEAPKPEVAAVPEAPKAAAPVPAVTKAEVPAVVPAVPATIAPAVVPAAPVVKAPAAVPAPPVVVSVVPKIPATSHGHPHPAYHPGPHGPVKFYH